MCGVFAFLGAGRRGPDLNVLAELALSAERRGRQAHGLAWIDRAGRLRRYRAPGPISRNLGCLDFVEGARAVIGHCRFATAGDPDNNRDNHPHSADGGWIVHNGTVRNAGRLARRYGLPVSTACDSEVLGLLIEEARGTLADRIATTIAVAEGPAVVLGLWTRPLRLVIVRRGNPLHVSQDVERGVYWGSLADGLPAPAIVPADRLSLWAVRGQKASVVTERRLPPCLPTVAARNARPRPARKQTVLWR